MSAATERYFTDQCCICRRGNEGIDALTNFTARIVRELIYHDGAKTQTHLVIDGRLHDDEEDGNGQPKYPDGKPLPEITIPATEFAGLNWVPERWGMTPIIYPVASSERDTRTAIQVASKPERQHIYTHTGWTKIGSDPHYLTTSGGIGPKGLNTAITVQLPHELSRYSLPKPAANPQAFMHSLRLVNVGPPPTTWPLLLATYRACIGPADFAIHLAGRTGTFKSEVSSLFQSHYGKEMDARHLPASWSSTGNALEALAYRAKDALMTIDDFIPVGTAYHVRNLQKNADQIIRGQGNQSGRSRLTDAANMQTTYYARGILLSTGEDVPEGHSVRGRMLIVELAPNSIDPARLSLAQQNRELYPQALADWIHWLAETNAADRLKEMARDIRDQHLGKGHTRTPQIVGDLLATLVLMRAYNEDRGYVPDDSMSQIEAKAKAAVLETANSQKAYLEAADPVKATLETIRLILGSGLAHAKTVNGGIPTDSQKFGWTEQRKAGGGLPDYKSNGPRIGWIDEDSMEFLLDHNSLPFLKKFSGGKLAVTTQTLLKRMKEAGLITRCDDSRQRLTVRQTLEGTRRQAICMNAEDVFDESEGD